MKERILDYLKKEGKSSVNDLAAALEMTGSKAFPKLIKDISHIESQGLIRFDDSGKLSLRTKRKLKKK